MLPLNIPEQLVRVLFMVASNWNSLRPLHSLFDQPRHGLMGTITTEPSKSLFEKS
jgi:hypothetical protein